MTLILSVGGPTFCLQVSDRRLTRVSNSGRVITVSEQSSKAILLHSLDAQLVVGFTGLARAPRFETQERLLLHVRELGQAGVHQSLPILHGLAERLTRDLSRVAADPLTRRLSVLVTGYRQVGEAKQLSVGLISNFQTLRDVSQETGSTSPWPSLRVFTEVHQDPLATAVFTVGVTRSIPTEDVRLVRQAVGASGARFEDIAELTARIVQTAAHSPTGRRTIGDSVMMTAVFSDGREPTGRYFSDSPSPTLYFPDIVTALPGYANRIRLRLEAHDPTTGLTTPPTHRRRPCPCGSGRRYRDCHGKYPNRADQRPPRGGGAASTPLG